MLYASVYLAVDKTAPGLLPDWERSDASVAFIDRGKVD